jgi:2-C-methyl-D-erythritol 2,4-cyclodiphosphate synthase
MSMRIGFGYDSHAFKPGVPLRIGGLPIDHAEGLAGHSDGDVLLHALTDALLGAVAAGDIGTFFPPSDARWKDAESAIFLILAQPKISPIAGEMRERVAILLDVLPSAVSIKAKTPEGLNLDHTAQAHAVVLLQRVEDPTSLLSISDVVESQKQLEDIVKDLVGEVHRSEQVKRTVVPVFDTEDIT